MRDSITNIKISTEKATVTNCAVFSAVLGAALSCAEFVRTLYVISGIIFIFENKRCPKHVGFSEFEILN